MDTFKEWVEVTGFDEGISDWLKKAAAPAAMAGALAIAQPSFGAAPVEPPKAVAVDGEKLPIPSGEELRDATLKIKNIFNNEIVNAKTTTQKEALIRKFLQVASNTQDKVHKYVLLEMARTGAVGIGDSDLATTILREMKKHFNVPSSVEYSTMMSVGAKATEAPAYIESVKLLINSALERDDYIHAQRLIQMALKASTRYMKGPTGTINLRVKEMYDELSIQNKFISDMRNEFFKIRTLIERLKTNPDDLVANEKVGKFYAFYKEDWGKGLPMLEKGTSNDFLSTAASMDLSVPTEPKRQLELGDLWWRISDGERGVAQNNIRKRASEWYDKVIPHLSGLEKARVENRSKSVGGGNTKEEIEKQDSLEKIVVGTWKTGGGGRYVFKEDGTYSRYSRKTGKLAFEGKWKIKDSKTILIQAIKQWLPLHMTGKNTLQWDSGGKLTKG